MKKYLLAIVVSLLMTSLVIGQGIPEFETVPDDRSMTSSETVTLEWIVRNAEGYTYQISVMVQDGPLQDAAKGHVQNDRITYMVVSPPVGNLTVNLVVETQDEPLNDTVFISVTEDLGLDSTVETNINTGNFPIQAFLVSSFGIFVLRKKYRK